MQQFSHCKLCTCSTLKGTGNSISQTFEAFARACCAHIALHLLTFPTAMALLMRQVAAVRVKSSGGADETKKFSASTPRSFVCKSLEVQSVKAEISQISQHKGASARKQGAWQRQASFVHSCMLVLVQMRGHSTLQHESPGLTRSFIRSFSCLALLKCQLLCELSRRLIRL